MNIIKTSIEALLSWSPESSEMTEDTFLNLFPSALLMKRYAKSISYRTMKANRLTE